MRTLVETGVLVGEPGAYRLAQALLTIQVPATVQAVLAARIDRLAPEDKRLLQTAAQPHRADPVREPSRRIGFAADRNLENVVVSVAIG